jgi:predicted permease
MLQRMRDALLGRARRDADLEAELTAHLEHQVHALVQRGWSEEDAKREARLRLGNPTGVAEQTRDVWWFAVWTGIWQDARFALRWMRRAPVFTLAAVASLALGIGANTAIYSVFERVLFGELPVRDPEELVQVVFRDAGTQPGSWDASLPYPLWRELAYESGMGSGTGSGMGSGTGIADLSCIAVTRPSFAENASTRMVLAELTCPNYFQTMGLRPQLGRLLRPGDERVVVLADHFWRSQYGADPTIVGKKLTLSGTVFEVVGVAPREYFSSRKTNAPALFVPIEMDGVLMASTSITADPQSYWLAMFGRVRGGANREALEQALTARMRGYLTSTGGDGEENKRRIATLRVSLLSARTGVDSHDADQEYRAPFLCLMAVVGTVLLIACINIANLLLARASARQREIATRLAIGASRWRLVRQFLTESLALALLGGALGIALALAMEQALLREAMGASVLVQAGGLPSSGVMWFALGVTLLAALLFGLAPAWTADRQGLQVRSRFLGRKLMVSLQVALSVVLLSSAGLFLKTIERLRNTDAGFDRRQMVTLTVRPILAGMNDAQAAVYYRALEEKLAGTPGVRQAVLCVVPLMGFAQWSSGIQVEGMMISATERPPMRNAVSAGYFTALGSRLLAGRDFTAADNRPNAPKVAIVNESFARRYFGGASPLGRRIGVGNQSARPEHEIVGVVRDLLDFRLGQERESYWYVPYAQQARMNSMTVVARVEGDLDAMLKTVRAEVAAVDARVPISRETTMADNVEQQIQQERLIAYLSAFFAGVAVLLAVVGLYGVMSYTVERRTREIGIRVALGESRAAVMGRVLREAGMFVGLGALGGVGLAWSLAGLLEKLLHGVPSRDFAMLLAAVGVVALFGMAAGYVTARRAAGIDPARALAAE